MRLRQGDSEIPEDLLAALDADPQAKAAFERSPTPYREGLLALVREARDQDHREHRITLVISTLLQ